jgi:hypothetical protein
MRRDGRGSDRRLLDPAQERAVRAALADGGSWSEAAAAAGLTYSLLRQRRLDQLADVRLGRGAGRKARHADPSREEIALRAAEVRRRWTEADWGLGGDPDASRRSGRIPGR